MEAGSHVFVGIRLLIKDVMGPRGCVSIIMDESAASASVDTQTKTVRIRVHDAATAADGTFVKPDELLSMHDEPDRQQLCEREGQFVLDAIRTHLDVERHFKTLSDLGP